MVWSVLGVFPRLEYLLWSIIFHYLGAKYDNFCLHLACGGSYLIAQGSRRLRHKPDDVVEVVQLSLAHDPLVEHYHNFSVLAFYWFWWRKHLAKIQTDTWSYPSSFSFRFRLVAQRYSDRKAAYLVITAHRILIRPNKLFNCQNNRVCDLSRRKMGQFAVFHRRFRFIHNHFWFVVSSSLVHVFKNRKILKKRRQIL